MSSNPWIVSLGWLFIEGGAYLHLKSISSRVGWVIRDFRACLWIRCPWGNVTSIVPFHWRLELQSSLKTAFLAILSNNCVFKICSWYQLSNFKVLLQKMTVQIFTQLNPATPKILFLTRWQRTMWAAIFVLDSALSFPLLQRCSSFIQLKLWYKAIVPVVWSVLSTVSMQSSYLSFIGLWTFSHISHFLTGISRP